MSSTSLQSTAMCPCECEYLDKIDYWSDEANQLKQYNELSQKLAELKRLLNVETKNLSSFINKKISAADERPSASVTGYLGAAVLGLVFGLIFLLDLPVIIHQIRGFFRNI
uniref:Uncharacterized protein LOC111099756 n=1 Tax=Crassostrea virginica TaxID=6565 RepID=A0A8B8A6X0_CRAVI|nr:uncharacterized protein LOC111099756 [Crassostrea virginica]